MTDETKKETKKNNGPKYPKIRVQLTGRDGNAFAILGAVTSALRKAKVSDEEIRAFQKEATSGDYDHLLFVCTEWVDAR